MKIDHNVILKVSPEMKEELEDCGISVELGMSSFSICEDDDSWKKIGTKLCQWDASFLTFTTFTDQELDSAQWLEMSTNWHHGYPQPKEDSFGYIEACLDMTKACPDCMVGFRQDRPYRMKNEPKWGRRSVMGMNWVFDALFVKPELYRSIFKPFGIGKMEVLKRNSMDKLKTVVQLVCDEEVDVRLEGASVEVCQTCSVVKYQPWTRGKFPPLVKEPKGHMAMTKEFFGSGGVAFHNALVSRELYQRLKERERGTRGVSFSPVQES